MDIQDVLRILKNGAEKPKDDLNDYTKGKRDGQVQAYSHAWTLVKKLSLSDVRITLPPEENIINAMKLLTEIDYENECVWGHDTDLGKPKDVIEAFKNELLGN